MDEKSLINCPIKSNKIKYKFSVDFNVIHAINLFKINFNAPVKWCNACKQIITVKKVYYAILAMNRPK